MNAEKLWEGIWKRSVFTPAEFTRRVTQEERSLRWKKIERETLGAFKSFRGLKVLELGSGAGIGSLLMALRGAEVSLLDFSEEALEKARALFCLYECKAHFFKADIFDLPEESVSGYDVTMSFGVCEHFSAALRQESIKAHYTPLKDEGMSFISVPNRSSFPYRFWKKKLEILKKWDFGTEIPFSRQELKELALRAGFFPVKAAGSALLSSINTYLLYGMISKIGINPQIPSPFDDYLADTLILIGHKSRIQ